MKKQEKNSILRPLGALIATVILAGGIATAANARITNPPAAGLAETDIDTSAKLAAIISDETGTAGNLVFSGGPTFTGTLTLSGIATDITSGTNEDIKVIPNGTGDFIVETGGGSNALYVDTSANNVGIGVAPNAGADLHVYNGGGVVVQRFDSGTNYSEFVDVAGDFYITADRGGAGSKNLILRVGGTTQVGRFDSNGRFVVGTDDTPDYKLEVQGTSGNGYLGITNATDGDIFEIDPNGNVGIASSTPVSKLSLGSGAITTSEYVVATSTTPTLNFTNGNQQLYRHGTSATTVSFTGLNAGASMRLYVCNPGGTAGAITWSGVYWPGGAAPTQTTTANVCDLWTFNVTNGTSTPIVVGGGVQNYGI